MKKFKNLSKIFDRPQGKIDPNIDVSPVDVVMEDLSAKKTNEGYGVDKVMTADMEEKVSSTPAAKSPNRKPSVDYFDETASFILKHLPESEAFWIGKYSVSLNKSKEEIIKDMILSTFKINRKNIENE